MIEDKLAFITGITGQDGSYLSELLLEKGYKVYGIVRRTSLLYSYSRIDHIRNLLNIKYGDLTDNSGLLNFINNIITSNPNFQVFEIYNLAAQSHVAISFDLPKYTSDVDAIGVLNILEIIKSQPQEIKNKIKFYQASTSELYGKVKEIPQSEETPFNPVSPYACAKLYSYYLTKIYRESYDLYCVNGILFNHESPRRGDNFLTMKVVKGVEAIIQGKKKYIELGNLDSKRDWGHAKDYCRGMWLMMQQQKSEIKDYVLATNKTYSVRTFVERAFLYRNITIKWKGEGINEVGIDNKNNEILVKINVKHYRPLEVDYLQGTAEKAEKELGWKREFDTLDDLIQDMFLFL